ncbi:MAG: UDP-glucose/GDP-mannose dehydrogenase family protein [Candidatus Micrarchaeaceae archaeon]
MKIGVVGLGYVGLVTAAVLSVHGNEVYGIDIDKKKIDALKKGKLPIFEPGLEDIVFSKNSNIKLSNSYDDLKDADVIFVAVPTPTVNNQIDLSYVFNAAKSIAKIGKFTIIIRSTVIPGTARKVMDITGLNVISNPEFMREGNAIKDTEYPDRIVIGGKNTEVVEEIWGFTKRPMIITTNENAELIKYTSNSFLATKISFINEIANLCEKIPRCDIEIVAKGMGLDPRIGDKFLKAGLGFGGSCFPKDTKAMVSFADQLGIELSIVKAAIKVNEKRINHVLEMIRNITNEKKILVLGLAFKENTDDIRESRSLLLINALIENGFTVKYYDPVVKTDIKISERCEDIENCIKESKVIAIATEWPIFKNYEKIMDDKIVIDLRRILDSDKIKNYRGVGLGPKS